MKIENVLKKLKLSIGKAEKKLKLSKYITVELEENS